MTPLETAIEALERIVDASAIDPEMAAWIAVEALNEIRRELAISPEKRNAQ